MAQTTPSRVDLPSRAKVHNSLYRNMARNTSQHRLDRGETPRHPSSARYYEVPAQRALRRRAHLASYRTGRHQRTTPYRQSRTKPISLPSRTTRAERRLAPSQTLRTRTRLLVALRHRAGHQASTSCLLYKPRRRPWPPITRDGSTCCMPCAALHRTRTNPFAIPVDVTRPSHSPPPLVRTTASTSFRSSEMDPSHDQRSP